MNDADGSESFAAALWGDAVDPDAGDTATAETAGSSGTRQRASGETSLNAAQAIAENPVMLRLAGTLISGAAKGSHVRFERVAALREAIEAGAYGVSSGDLADKLMDGMRVNSSPGQARSRRSFP